MTEAQGVPPSESVERHNPFCFHSMIQWDCLSCLEGALWRCDRAYQTLKAGLEKAVKDDDTEWVDANIIRLLLDRAPTSSAPAPSP